mmetsp:Transcript_46691/g.149961  ORF Transcript_46691/g.149961 Transcript_46691/m.149961 type:complete len:271 (+) Transcript_46691:438-1250(+)
MMAAAILGSSPGFQLCGPAASFSGSSHFFRCSISFSPRVTLNQLLSSSSSRARPWSSGMVRALCLARLTRMGRRLLCRSSFGSFCCWITRRRPSLATVTVSDDLAVRDLKNMAVMRCLRSATGAAAEALNSSQPHTVHSSSIAPFRRRVCAACWRGVCGLGDTAAAAAPGAGCASTCSAIASASSSSFTTSSWTAVTTGTGARPRTNLTMQSTCTWASSGRERRGRPSSAFMRAAWPGRSRSATSAWCCFASSLRQLSAHARTRSPASGL